MDFIEQWFGVSPDGGDGSLELQWIAMQHAHCQTSPPSVASRRGGRGVLSAQQSCQLQDCAGAGDNIASPAVRCFR